MKRWYTQAAVAFLVRMAMCASQTAASFVHNPYVLASLDCRLVFGGSFLPR
jgi:hypothetical protein